MERVLVGSGSASFCNAKALLTSILRIASLSFGGKELFPFPPNPLSLSRALRHVWEALAQGYALAAGPVAL